MIAVEDNGRGMTPEKLAEIKAGLLRQREEEKESYGLYNVNERIRLRFGNQYGLSFYSEDHAGTKVEIYLPVAMNHKKTNLFIKKPTYFSQKVKK